MSDLWSPRRRNTTHIASSDEAFRRYNDVLPPSPRHRGRSQTRIQNDPSPVFDCPSSSRMPSTASKLMTTMKRSLSYGGAQKKRSSSLADSRMLSTPEESLPPSPTPYSAHDMRHTRPTIEQIAMGLHISRTPHITPIHMSKRRVTADYPQHTSEAPSSRRASMQHHRRGSAPPLILPPPPPRSSLKTPTTKTPLHSTTTSPIPLTPSASDASLSSLTSAAPSTPRSNRSTSTGPGHFSTKLQLSMSKLLQGRKGSVSMASPEIRSSDSDSTTSVLTPRKVRFSPGVDGEV
ncbi:hypothetical protein QCA50_011051 [Cerrena zonata]|uniref:Uncharacterized protein n=1 Tax=Cerrena zonata TaxID=2478898 RepID=A0AAW0G7H0_9APHY